MFNLIYIMTTLFTIQALERKKEVFDETSLSQMIEPLTGLLRCQGLMTDRLELSPLCTFAYIKYPQIFDVIYSLYFLLFFRLRTELESGIQYWSLERKLCQALSRNEKVCRGISCAACYLL